ncbi:MAG: Cpe/LpqF family protein [Halioglobus sp.]
MAEKKHYRYTVVVALLLAASCKHGIEIVGEGRVSSATGDRDCAPASSPCTFEVDEDYNETYTAIPADGYVFDSWSVCLQSEGNVCTFAIPKQIVDDYQGQTFPSTVAKFRKPIQPLFRTDTEGKLDLPDTPAANQFAWFLGELSKSSTSTGEIEQHFSDDFLENTASAAEVRDLFDDLRAAIPSAIAIEMVTVTPNFVRAIIGLPENPAVGYFVSLETDYSPNAPMTVFSANPFPHTGTQTSASDNALTLAQVRDKFKTFAQNTSMLVADIAGNSCKPIVKHRSKAIMPTGSIFKIWVLGAGCARPGY